MPPRPAHTFTAEEDARIIARYSATTLKAIAAELGVARWQSVQLRVNQLIRQGRLDRHDRAYAPPWSEADDELLATWWGLLPDATVARKLGRTPGACKIRATRQLGLARKDQFYTVRAVARLFGVDDHRVRAWIDEGLLQAVRSTVRSGDGNLAWRIEHEWIEAFLREWPWRYDRRRIEAGTYWRNLADRVAAADPFVDVREAARILGVCVETVRRWVREGELEAERTPGAGGYGELRFARLHVENARRRLPQPRRRPTGPKAVRLDRPWCADCGRRFTHPNHYRRRGPGRAGVCRQGCAPAPVETVSVPPVGPPGLRLVAVERAVSVA